MAGTKVDLLTSIKGESAGIDEDVLSTLKISVLGLFDDILRQEDLDAETRGIVARARARVAVEFRDIT